MAMDLRQHCELMHRYQGWALAQLYAGLAPLSDADYRRDAGLYFRSIHATLNHLLLVDHVWYGRMVREPFAVRGLGDELEPDRARLQQRLAARPAAWLAHLASLDDAALAGPVEFHKLDGTPARLPRASAMLHVVNHATHHRGQVSAAMTALGLPAPELDYVMYLYTLPDADLYR